MKKKQNKVTSNKNFFKAMNYEMAGEIGVIDNEDMINNKKLNSTNRKNKK